MPDQRPPAVVATDLTVEHDGHTALRGATFEAPAGTTAVIGPNGSGKTSLLQAISGVVDVTASSLLVLDTPPQAGRPDVAHVLQSTKVNEALPLTVLEVVRMGRYPHLGPLRRFAAEDHAAVEHAIERLGLTDLARRPLRDLSGGQQQRAFVAQGLAQQANLLLLDEPITGLDLPSQQRIDQVIGEEISAGRSIIFTTHDVATAASAQTVLLLATHLVAAGPPSKVLTDEHLAHAYGGRTYRTPDGSLVIGDPHVHGAKVVGHDDH